MSKSIVVVRFIAYSIMVGVVVGCGGTDPETDSATSDPAAAQSAPGPADTTAKAPETPEKADPFEASEDESRSLVTIRVHTERLAETIRQQFPPNAPLPPVFESFTQAVRDLGLTTVEIHCVRGVEIPLPIVEFADPTGALWKAIPENALVGSLLTETETGDLVPDWENVPNADSIPTNGGL